MKRLPAMPEFLAPLPLCAVALMAVNDRWLKPTFHNALTGKLSDVAICFFLPLYVSALLALVTRWPRARRVAVGAGITACLYTALKVSQPAADLFCELLRPLGALLGITGFRAWADPTDLVTLPLIWAAVRYSRAAAHERPPLSASSPTGVSA
ncbi:hypothetical protein [Corallococcus macrosporus]|uniref:Uncharacterized protein n=2 Tax=Myxococcaceae TaxID=31 RepID=A0A250K2V5_9BACT|nr:hypothetical protein [Corallococcus macrosporus]AEI64853.1 hypothetical protein LILAB_14740 [Corallococcus macrosporus]ATB50424.1 hypothetical protein MYMAC_006080 [Corallococcus macrosporus DSM 14697]